MRTPSRVSHLLAGARWPAEVEPYDHTLARRLDLLDLVEGLHPTLDLRGLGGVGREAFDEALLLGQHGLLPRVGRLAVGLPQGSLPLVEVVVARVRRDLPLVDLGDAPHDAVHEVAVVGRHEERAVERFQERLEPENRFDVQVVGGLVHQQDIGTTEEYPRHGHPHLPPSREGSHVAVDALVIETEAAQHLTGLRLQRVATRVVVLLLHLSKARQDAVEVPSLLRVAHGVLQGLELVVEVAQTTAASDGLVENRATRHLLHVLTEIADGELLRHRDFALVRRLLPHDHAEERRLAGAIGTHEADALSGVQLEGGFDEKDLPTVLLRDTRERDHPERVRQAGPFSRIAQLAGSSR